MIDITRLADTTAQRILTTIAHARSDATKADSAGLRDAIAAEFGIDPAAGTVPPGDLARQALLVLAEDPDTRQAIEAMASEEPSARRNTYDGGTSIALGIAAYYALSTALDFKIGSGGKWSFRMQVRPAGEAAVKALVQKLTAIFPENPLHWRSWHEQNLHKSAEGTRGQNILFGLPEIRRELGGHEPGTGRSHR